MASTEKMSVRIRPRHQVFHGLRFDPAAVLPSHVQSLHVGEVGTDNLLLRLALASKASHEEGWGFHKAAVFTGACSGGRRRMGGHGQGRLF